jgi:hypothetical protein
VKRLVVYHDRFTFRFWPNDGHEEAYGTLKHHTFFKDKLNAICAGLFESVLVPEDYEDGWVHDVLRGDDAPLEVLLLSLAPNVSTLIVHLTPAGYSGSHFIDVLLSALQKVAGMPGHDQS